MAQNDNTFRLKVITPEASLLDTDVQSVSFSAHDGEIGIRPKRAPLVIKLGIGQLRYTAADGSERRLFIDGGVAQVVHNEAILLTQSACNVADIDRDAAEKDLADAREKKIPDDDAFVERQNALQRARAKIRLAR